MKDHLPSHLPRWASTSEIEQALPVKGRTLRKWANKSENGIVKRREGKSTFYDTQSIQAYLDRRKPAEPHSSLRYTLWVPEGFDFEACLPLELKSYSDQARYLVHCIWRKNWLEDRERECDVRLMAKYLRRFMIKSKFKALVEALITAEAVIVRRSRKPGVASSYRLGPAIVDLTFVPYIAKHARLRTAIRRRIDEVRQEVLDCPIHSRLVADLHKVSVLAEDAKKAYRRLTNDQVHIAMMDHVIDRIDSGQHYCIPGPWGRTYHTFCNLKRELRAQLRFNGKTLVEIDVANSQPLMLGFLCLQSLGRRITPIRLMGEIKEERKAGKRVLLCPVSPILANVDARRYLSLCESGGFYHELRRLGQDPVAELPSDLLKKRLYSEVFFHGHVIPDNPLVAAMRELSPAVYRFICSCRHGGCSVLSGPLQAVESEIIIRRILPRLQLELPYAALIPIHDSIMTTPEHLDHVKQVFLDEFAKLNLCVTVKDKSHQLPPTPKRMAIRRVGDIPAGQYHFSPFLKTLEGFEMRRTYGPKESLFNEGNQDDQRRKRVAGSP